MHEDLNRWKSGQCFYTDNFYKLEQHDILESTDEIIAATQDERRILRGARCRFLGFDDDGDVILQHGWHRFISSESTWTNLISNVIERKFSLAVGLAAALVLVAAMIFAHAVYSIMPDNLLL